MSSINFKVIGGIEEWKPVKGYEGFYEVSNMGRVRSLDRVKSWYKGSTLCEVRSKGRVLKQVAHNNKFKYLVVNLSQQKEATEKRKQKVFYVHRLVAEAFIPNPEDKGDVNHIDGNTHNNRVDNLEWTTRKENIAHAFRTGLTKNYGSNHVFAKLSEDQVKEIRKSYQRGKYGSGSCVLAKKYGVSPSTIKNIVRGASWKRT